MSLYTLQKPCIIAGRHHVTLGVIDVDDDVAAPLVADGALEPYRASTPTVEEFDRSTLHDHAEPGEHEPSADEPPTISPPPRRARGKRAEA